MGMTTVAVAEDNWERLNRLKRPGESFDDVIGRLLDARDDADTAEASA